MYYTYFIDKTPEIQSLVAPVTCSSMISNWHKENRLITHGSARPTDIIPVIAMNQHKHQSVFPMTWGFSDQTPVFAIRTETAAERYPEEWAKHRCIIPASYYFENMQRADINGEISTGERYLIQTEGSIITHICGLYRFEDNRAVCTILTREAGEKTRFIHDRMPLIMPEARIRAWISPDEDPEVLVKEAVTEMYWERVDD